MANTIANSMVPMCPTRVFYKGKEIDIKDIIVVWSDNFGRPDSGTIEDFASSRAGDAVGEFEAGEGF